MMNVIVLFCALLGTKGGPVVLSADECLPVMDQMEMVFVIKNESNDRVTYYKVLKVKKPRFLPPGQRATRNHTDIVWSATGQYPSGFK